MAVSRSPVSKGAFTSKTIEGPKSKKPPEQPRSILSWKKRAWYGQSEVPTPARGKSLEGKRNGGMAPEVGTEAQSKKGRKNNVCGARASHVPVEAVEQPHPSQ
jgi:hypothetical protein